MSTTLSRRRFLGAAAAALAAGPIATNVGRSLAAAAPSPFRFLHLTDIHVQPELAGDAGLIRCLKAANALDAQFVLTGGDLVMDVFDQDHARAQLLFDL